MKIVFIVVSSKHDRGGKVKTGYYGVLSVGKNTRVRTEFSVESSMKNNFQNLYVCFKRISSCIKNVSATVFNEFCPFQLAFFLVSFSFHIHRETNRLQ